MNGDRQVVDIQEQSLTINWIDTNWFRTLLITTLVLGVFFRLYGLGNKIYSHDEIYTSLYAVGYRGGDVFTSLWDGNTKTVVSLREFLKPNESIKITKVISVMAKDSPHQAPLFFILEYYWMKLIGFSPSAMRSLSAIFGLLSIPTIYWLIMELFQTARIAFLATAFFSISPYHILFAQDARPYSLWALITIWSSASLLHAMRKRNTRSWVVYSLTLILGVYSHQLFVLVAITHGIYFTYAHFTYNKNRYAEYLSALLFAILIYMPWLFFVVTRLQVVTRQLDVLSMEVSWYRYIQRWVLLFSSPIIDIDLNSNVGNLVPYILRTVLLIFIVCTVLFLLRHGSQRQKLFLLLIYIITVGTFVVLDLIFGGMRSITGRYFVPANIATVIVVSYFLANKLDQTQAKTFARWKYLTISLILIGIISNVNSLFAKTWWNKELGRVRTEFVNEINKDQTLLIVSGSHPTNLGDVLMFGFAIDRDVQFKLYRDPADIKFSHNYRNVYWFPGTYSEILEISAKEQIEIREVLQGTLWRIVYE